MVKRIIHIIVSAALINLILYGCSNAPTQKAANTSNDSIKSQSDVNEGAGAKPGGLDDSTQGERSMHSRTNGK